MYEHFSERKQVGFIEDELRDVQTMKAIIAVLEEEYPDNYEGDLLVPDDPTALHLAHDLTSRIWPFETQSEDRQVMYVVFYRTLGFCYKLATLLKTNSNQSLSFEGTFGRVEAKSSSEIATYMYEKGGSYLSCRPNVDAIVGRFVGAVSPHPSLDFVTASMIGVWLRAYDEGDEIQRFKEIDFNLSD